MNCGVPDAEISVSLRLRVSDGGAVVLDCGVREQAFKFGPDKMLEHGSNVSGARQFPLTLQSLL